MALGRALLAVLLCLVVCGFSTPRRRILTTDAPQCRDDIDNDSDGQIDYPADSGCVDQSDNVELGLSIVQECTDTEADEVSTCVFGSNVTSGNLVLCMLANGEDIQESNLVKSSGTSTIGTVTQSCDATGLTLCSLEIHTAAVTGTGSLTMGYDWDGIAASTSIYCAELSSYSTVGNFAEDEDADDPQAETITTTAGAYIFGMQCDWNATAAAQNYVNSPAHTELLYHRDASSYTVVHYRSTATVAGGSLSFGMDGGWTPTSGKVTQCLAQVRP